MVTKKNAKEDQGKQTKYEIARMLGSRALQISYGAPFMIKLTKKQLEDIRYNPIEIAKMEFAENALPFTVVRVNPKSLSLIEQEKTAKS
ncbi:DNA-directed RNA polymerase subunit K [Candidatus Woesearchaeota archaeon CG11_big_fil_rev_8_21_14_0_20_43_8]|nr:MAG: DNA-directed RNA polymerase subunit K [Candidatus Woesearchaeota archaeon CG11_big_fil_rev_8_21_14_0_20_43_8]PIO05716.1 MAG: DNA-directed RNA polymerase subunit K [Candidatus Woesearchaeota archaeon CG08_land_8_20_14_0_20_43_7]